MYGDSYTARLVGTAARFRYPSPLRRSASWIASCNGRTYRHTERQPAWPLSRQTPTRSKKGTDSDTAGLPRRCSSITLKVDGNSLLIADALPHATFTLVAEIVMGVALLVGSMLARRQHYRAHRYWQSAVVLLNLALIATFMLPSFGGNVLPGLPSSLDLAYYGVAAVHGVLGLVAELLALYVLLAAGTNLLPERWRITRYKRWMRSTLVLWWLALLFGSATYYVWYIQTSTLAATGARAAGRTVTLTNYAYQPKSLTVPVGTTVIWRDLEGTHTVHADRRAFHSSPLVPGRGFSHTFREPGIYLYHCDFHGAPGGIGMAGRIVVVSH